MNVNPELAARILRDRSDLSAYLVYSDWLIERGDPRGELIAVQAKLRDDPKDANLRATEKALLDKHGAEWLGPLHGKVAEDLALEFQLGFLDKVRIGPPINEYKTGDIDLAEALGELMTDVPHTAFIREIVLGSKEDDEYQPSWQPEIDILTQNGVPAGLERLVFHSGGYWDISSTSLGNLEPLFPRLGKLRELMIHMGFMTFGQMNLPALRSLEIETGSLTKDEIRSIVSASWPELDRLSIYIGETNNDYGCNVELADLTPIFAAQNLDRVRHLGLCNSSLADDIAQELAGSTILKQLESLALGYGTLGDRGGQALLDERFHHLKHLDLTRSYLSEEMQKTLGDRFGSRVILARQGDDDEDDRYVSISE